MTTRWVAETDRVRPVAAPDRPFAHDDRCESTDLSAGQEIDCRCGVRETTWIMDEARELFTTSGSACWASGYGETAEWQARRDAFQARKASLLAYVEEHL